MSFFINGGNNMAKKKMEFDFSVFGCYKKQAREAFEAAGYEVVGPKPKPEFKLGQRVKVTGGDASYVGKFGIVTSMTLSTISIWLDYCTSMPRKVCFWKQSVEPHFNDGEDLF